MIVLRRKHICAARVCCCGAVKRAQRAKTLPACSFGGVSSSRILDGGFLDSFAPQICVQRRFVAAATCAQRATTLPACNLCLKTSSRSLEGCILNNFQTRICLRSAAAAEGRITSRDHYLLKILTDSIPTSLLWRIWLHLWFVTWAE